MTMIVVKDLSEQEVNYWITKLLMKEKFKDYIIYISPIDGVCKARKDTGTAPCAFEVISLDFKQLWSPIINMFSEEAEQLIPTDVVSSLRRVLTFNFGDEFDVPGSTEIVRATETISSSKD